MAEPASLTRPKAACGCKFSDAWKCAVEQRLTDRIACRCRCHDYVRDQLKTEHNHSPVDLSWTPETTIACWHDTFQPDEHKPWLEHLAATIDHAFNCADEDSDVLTILEEAVLRAASYIDRQPCTCTDGDACDRCQALGRDHNKPRDR